MNKVQDGLRNRTVAEVFAAHSGRQIDKWEHYFDIYERHFAKYVGTKVRMLEIGIDHGGSLQMWKEYFGPQAEIVGIDINTLSMYEEPQITTIAMDQTDPDVQGLGYFDIILDDGSHELRHQSESFRLLWEQCGGVYLIEDCHYGWPYIQAPKTSPAIRYEYPWVVVLERPTRIIKGAPSRILRQDEADARVRYGK